MKIKLLENLLLIAQIQNADTSNDLQNRIRELLDENGFETDDNIPAWMIGMYTNIANQKPIGKSHFKTQLPDKGDFTNFAEELEGIIDGEYDFYGEGYVIIYRKLGLKITLIYEGNFYTIDRLL